MFRSGYWTIGRWRGALVRLHWSIPVVALIFGRFTFDPGYLVGFVVLVLVHEVGHALLAWRYGHDVRVIEVTGFGGVCQWSGNASPYEEAAIAWGGVLAQAVLLVGAEVLMRIIGAPGSVFLWSLLGTLVHSNLWLMAVNLMPIPPLDGAKAWQFFAEWRRRSRGPVPHGSWSDPSPDAQRTWLERLERDAPKPSADTQRTLDDLVRRATAAAKEEEKR